MQKEPGQKPKPQQEVIVHVPLSWLHDFPNHPFKVRDDEAMLETAESIRQYGVLVPALARPREDGGYGLIAGYRRKHACELAGLTTMPVIVRDIDRDAATIIMVDSNLQRENILPSERAQAYKMKLEAIRRKAGRPAKSEEIDTTENGGQNGHDLRGIKSRELLAENSDDSARTIQRYIRLTELSPELQQMVDEKKIALSPAYQLAALTPKEQGLLLETIDSEQATPSLSQAQRMKKLGCTALRCPWLAERIEAGVVGYREAVLETFPHERRLFQRLNLLIKHYPGSLWSCEQHERRMQYQCAVQGYRRRRDTNAYYAAMYLLTSNDDIYRRTANCFCKDRIEFGYAVLSMNADDFVGGHSILALERFMDKC